MSEYPAVDEIDVDLLTIEQPEIRTEAVEAYVREVELLTTSAYLNGARAVDTAFVDPGDDQPFTHKCSVWFREPTASLSEHFDGGVLIADRIDLVTIDPVEFEETLERSTIDREEAEGYLDEQLS